MGALKILFLIVWPACWFALFITDFKWIADGFRIKAFLVTLVGAGAPWAIYWLFS